MIGGGCGPGMMAPPRLPWTAVSFADELSVTGGRVPPRCTRRVLSRWPVILWQEGWQPQEDARRQQDPKEEGLLPVGVCQPSQRCGDQSLLRAQENVWVDQGYTGNHLARLDASRSGKRSMGLWRSRLTTIVP